MSNKNLTLTQKRISNSKIFVYVCLALALALDVAVFIMLVVNALPVKYWLISLLFAVFDIGFLVISIISNFRFGYFIPYLVIYGIAFIGLSVAAFLIGSDFGAGTAYTHVALVLYPIMHLIAIATVIWTIVLSLRNENKSKVISIVAAVIMLAASVVYTLNLVGSGYFGQPLEEQRALLYSYDEALGGYKVVGVEGGAGTKVVIPEEFDGKKVSAVNCGVFTATGVKAVELNCAPTVRFDNQDELDKIEKLDISVTKDNFDAIRNVFYAGGHTRAVEIMEPVGLDPNSIFVTFAFTTDGTKDGELYPTWYGKKGDTLTLGADAPDWYSHSDHSSTDDLYFAYNSNNKKIFDGLTHNGANVDKTAVNDSLLNVDVKFDDVYRISIADDNDGSYEPADSYRYSYGASGTKLDEYRYVTLSSANALTDSIQLRTGFTLSWTVGANGTPIDTSLKDVLGESGNANTVTITPVWSLNAPAVTPITGNSTLTYGETLALNATASHVHSGISLKYEWYAGSKALAGSTGALEVENIAIDAGGQYSLIVTAYSEDQSVTTLTSSYIVSTNVSVGKRDLHFTWNVDSDTYTASDITASADYTKGDVINNDSITYTQSYYNLKNADDYDLYVTLTGDCDKKYRVVGDITYKVKPAPLTITVNDVTSREYNGEPLKVGECTYKQEGLLGGDRLGNPTYLSTALSVADADTYDITVVFPDDAAMLANYSAEYKKGTFVINKRKIKVEDSDWDYNDVGLTYDGTAQGIKVSAVDKEVSGDNVLAEFVYDNSTRGTDVGDYTMKATLVSKNYTLGDSEEVTRAFKIIKREITFTWSADTDFTYNGDNQRPDVVSAENIASRDRSTYLNEIKYSGEGKNAQSDNYTAKAEFDEAKGNCYKNYTVNGDTCNFTIKKRDARFVWNGDDSYTYDGTEKTRAVVYIYGSVLSEERGLVNAITYSGTNGTKLTEVGNTQITAALDNGNYNILDGSKTVDLEVTARPITFGWTGAGSHTYDGQGHTATVTEFNGAIQGDVNGFAEQLSYTNNADSSNNVSITNVGSITVKATLNNKNYTASNVTATVTITKRSVTFNWGGQGTFTYDGSTRTPTVTRIDNIVESEAEGQIRSIQYSGTNGTSLKDVGSTTVTATLDNDNYNVNASSTKVTLTINPKEIRLVWEGNDTYTYDGKTHTAHVTSVENEVDGEESKILEKITYRTVTDTEPQEPTRKDSPTIKDVGVLKIEAVLENNNYTVAVDTASVTVQVTPRPIRLVWTADENLAFGADTHTVKITYDGKTHTAHVTSIENEAEGEESIILEKITYSNAVSGSQMTPNTQPPKILDFGKLAIRATLNNDNYTIADNTGSVWVNIEARPISFVWSGDGSFEYDGSTRTLKVTDITNPVESEKDAVINSIKYTATNGTSLTNVGKTTVTASLDNSNYEVTGTVSKELEIYAKEITLVWPTVLSFEYNGNPRSVTVKSISTAVTGEEALLLGQISYTGTDGKPNPTITNVGSLTIRATLSNGNYKVIGGGEVTIYVTAKKITLQWQDKTSFEYDGNSHTVTIETFGGAVEKDIAALRTQVAYTNNADGTDNIYITEVGSITIKATLNSENYTADPVTVTISVTPKSVNVVWGETELTYNGNEQAPEFEIEGALNDSDAKMIKDAVTVSGKIKDVGGSTAVATLGDSVKNYVLSTSTTSCPFSVKAATLTIKWTVGDYTYDGAVHTPNIEIVGAVPSDLETLKEKITVSGGQADAGENLTATATLDSGVKNYVFASEQKCTYSIKKKAITVSWEDKSYTYNGTEQKPKIVSVNDTAEGGDTVDKDNDITVTVTAGGGINAGSHTVKATLNDTVKNYYFADDQIKTYTIEKQSIKLVWSDDDEFTEGDEINVAPTNVLPGGVELEYEYYLVTEDGEEQYLGSDVPSAVGKYKVKCTVKGDNAKNYELEDAEWEFGIVSEGEAEE